MDSDKREGIVFRPLYVPGKMRSTNRVPPVRVQEGPPCEMCGSQVISMHCRRVCTRCGFLTGQAEGI
jgi:hypothetical protein